MKHKRSTPSPRKQPSAEQRAAQQINRLLERLATICISDALAPVDLTAQQQQHFLQYVRLLLEWNQRIDLISPTDETRIAERHLLESLSLLSVWRFNLGASVLDLGSGAGLPGVPLKIMRPDLSMTLLEAKHKKALFLKAAIRTLQLERCRVIEGRAERVALNSDEKFSVVVARAVAALEKMWRWSQPLLQPDGVLLAMKGGDVEKEKQALLESTPEIQCRVLKYPVGWPIDPSRCVVAVTRTPKAWES
ncbi:MAG: 16S rRNA (guanine(527)-N(7))-methyltransferase RsmG [candidate division KSB1 bacterium]|nr:16S rRNA (guanine(527)-N(7))-methyltransferase RsmG [candidate division KSB1 bacterium]